MNSSNQSVATVNDGVFTPLSEGTVNITITTEDGGYTDTYSVIVLSIETSLYGLRLLGSNRYGTCVTISSEGWPNGSGYVLLARGDVFADALTGTPLAAALDAPLFLTP